MQAWLRCLCWLFLTIAETRQSSDLRARHDMRIWRVERRKRTRHLIELGGLVVKAGVVDLTGDDRAITALDGRQAPKR
jgi:hypothetical protein